MVGVQTIFSRKGYKMKIVILNASFRKNGATAKILNEFANQLNLHTDTNVEIFHLSDLNIKYCQGCCSCYKTGACFLCDDAEMLSKTISAADGLIIGSPCYASGVSGQLKTFIDRGHFVIEQLLKDKHTIGVVTYENAGGGSVWSTLKTLFVFSGAKTASKLVVKIPFNSNPVEVENIKMQIKNNADKLYNSIRNRSSSPLNKIIHFFVFKFGIKPFVTKKGEAYQGVLHHWRERGISHK